MLLNTLKYSGAITTIREGFSNITDDRRIQVILIAWLLDVLLKELQDLEHLLQLLPTHGCSRLSSVSCSCFWNDDSIYPVSFGAVGTPLIVGVQGGLDKVLLTDRLILKGLNGNLFFNYSI